MSDVPEFPRFLDDVSGPLLALPAGAWDTATHVYGDPDKYPVAPGRHAFRPPDGATLTALTRLHDQLGVDRGVLVQASSYRQDHRVLLDALKAADGRYVGVALMDDGTTDEELARLHAGGVRGVRFNLVSWLTTPTPVEVVANAVRRVSELGWCVHLHVDSSVLTELEESLSKLDGRVCIDHMAHMSLEEFEHGGRDLLARYLDRPNWWVRLSNADRASRETGPYPDGEQVTRAVYELAPDRTLWGTDWPHVFYRKPTMVDDGHLVQLLQAAIPEEEKQREVLVENPQRFYGAG